MLLLLAACDLRPPDPSGPDHTGAWPVEDTGLRLRAFAGGAEVDGDTFVDGYFGEVLVDSTGEVLCDNTGTWTAIDVGPDCPDCTWAFTLSVNDTLAYGPACDVRDMGEGAWDGFAGGWAYAETFEYEGDLLEAAVLYYDAEGSWWPLMYRGSPFGRMSGDATRLEFRVYTYAYYDGYDYD